MSDVLPFVHPLIGALAILAMLSLGTRGLQARQGVKNAHAKRRSHRQQGPYIAAAMAVAALTGTATVVLVRDDLDAAGSWHFWAGWVATTCMLVIAYATPRRFRGNGAVKTGHLVLGLTAMVVGVVALIIGIELLP